MNRQKEMPAGEAESEEAGGAAREAKMEVRAQGGAALLADRRGARLRDFGLADYVAVLAMQERLREARLREEIPDTWMFGEHPTVVTQGVRAREGDLAGGGAGATPVILVGPLAGAPVVKIDRGGMTTLHSPGQMILYPIVKLREGSLSAGRMAHALLEGMRRWVRDAHGVESEIPAGRPGLYVGGRKMLSVGISARGGVTMHGVAMNVSNDLRLWEGIVACGEPGTRPVSLSELLGRSVTPAEQRESIRAWLRDEWGYAEVVEEAADFKGSELRSSQ